VQSRGSDRDSLAAKINSRRVSPRSYHTACWQHLRFNIDEMRDGREERGKGDRSPQPQAPAVSRKGRKEDTGEARGGKSGDAAETLSLRFQRKRRRVQSRRCTWLAVARRRRPMATAEDNDDEGVRGRWEGGGGRGGGSERGRSPGSVSRAIIYESHYPRCTATRNF